MIRSFLAVTHEIDDPQAAVSDILSALDLENNLLKHSLGIISCFPDFEETGVLKAVCDALPFDCVGATTCLSAVNDEIDQLMLAITLLTSDDCPFSTLEIPIDDDYQTTIDTRLSQYLAKSDQPPVLFLSYFPLINNISGDMMLSALDATGGGIPLFGTSAVDHTISYSTAMTIHNGKMFRKSVILAGIFGNPKVTYEVASIDKDRIRKQRAIITQSDGNILIGVNGKTALEYLEELGLTKDELATGLGIIPFFVDYKGGTKPVARAVFTLTPEGHAVCGGAMPENATLSIGRIDREDVLRTTQDTVKPMLDQESVILSYSCLGRYLVLGAHNTAEAEALRDVAVGTDYMFACSSGEICPLPDTEGKLHNIYHNYTITFCRLS